MNLPCIAPLNPAPAACAAPKAAGTPDADGATEADGFARELDRAAAKGPDAAAPRPSSRDRSAHGESARAAHAKPPPPAGGASGAGRRATNDRAAADPQADDLGAALPGDAAEPSTPDETIDLVALIAAGREVDARADAAAPAPASAFGQAVVAAARERQAAQVAAADALDTPGRTVASAARDRSAAASAAGPEPFGRTVGRLAHDRNAALDPACAADPGAFGRSVAQLAHGPHAARTPAPTEGTVPTPAVDKAPRADGHQPPAAAAGAAAAAADPATAADPAARSAAHAAPIPETSAEPGAAAQPGAAALSAAQAPAPALPGSDPSVGDARRLVDVHEPVGSPRFAPALGERVVTLVRDGVGQAEVRLNPAELGPIAVHIRVDGTRAEVDFSAAHALTRQALQDAVPALAGALRESGLTLAGGGVFEQPRGSREPGADGAPRRGSAAQSGAAAAAGPQAVAAPVGRARGMVDLFA